MTVLPDGKVLIAGGRTPGNSTPTNEAEVYDPTTDTWTVTGSMPTTGYGSTAVVLGNGKVLVAGGLSTLAQALYDPTTLTWSSTGVTNSHPAGTTVTLLSDGRVLMASSITDIYDPTSNTWTPGATYPYSFAAYNAELLPNGSVLLINDVGKTMIYAPAGIPASDVWMTGSSVSAVAGTSVGYQLTVSNAGPQGATGLELFATIPEGLSLVSVTGNGASCSELPCHLVDLSAGSTEQLTVTVTPNIALSSSTYLHPVFSVYGFTWDPSRTNNVYTGLIRVQPAAVSADSVMVSGTMSVAPGTVAMSVSLPDGRVLVAGGASGATPLASGFRAVG